MSVVRNGYGSAFNELTIVDNEITKVAKNRYGHNKIKKEMDWYRFCEKSNILPVPSIIKYMDNGYTMKYYKEYVSLYKLFSNLNQARKAEILYNISSLLDHMHSTTEKVIDKTIFMKQIYEEIYNKTISRYAEIKPLVERYSYITHVNNIKIPDFNETVCYLRDIIHEYYNKQSTYTVACIHGDCQFNNILVTPNCDNLIFIDPRGYFGSLGIYGPKDYDNAKVAFALTGYDIFDNMDISTLDINKNNLTLPNLFQVQEPLERGSIITNWVISIWLGNAHCFKSNESKAMFSYFYALYLAAIYL